MAELLKSVISPDWKWARISSKFFALRISYQGQWKNFEPSFVDPCLVQIGVDYYESYTLDGSVHILTSVKDFEFKEFSQQFEKYELLNGQK